MKKLLFLLMLLPLGLCAQVVEDEDSLLEEFVTPSMTPYRLRKVVIKPSLGFSSSHNFELRCPSPLFRVIKAFDKSLRNCDVYAEVLERRKSNISGSEGRLVIRPLYILTNEGKKIRVSGDIYIRGLNRTNVKFWLGFLPFMWFVPGSAARTSSDNYTVFLE